MALAAALRTAIADLYAEAEISDGRSAVKRIQVGAKVLKVHVRLEDEDTVHIRIVRRG